MTKINEVSFTQDHLKKVTNHIGKIPIDVVREFNGKFENWRKTWNIAPTNLSSNLRDYAQSDEYETLLDFCMKQGKKVWPLLFQKEELYLINLYEDLMYPDRKEYMNEIKMKNRSNKYTSDGTYILYTYYGDWREFCKQVLEREFD